MDDSLATLRRSLDRLDYREGIPMVLAVVSEVGELPDVTDEAARAEGARLARHFDALRADLAPTLRDDDMGVVITILRTGSHEDLS